MSKSLRFLPVLVLPALVAGCAGPERKLARGLSNVTEFARGGEISRSVEQTTIWEGTTKGNTLGFVRGFNRSMARTLLGAAEVATFFAPWPSKSEDRWTYNAAFTPEGPLYPDYSVATYNEDWGGMRLPEDPGTPESYNQAWPATGVLDTDGEMGITGGSILPVFPFGRFKLDEQ